MREAARARKVLARLRREHGPRTSYLEHETPFQLLVAVILSAQNTDAAVNKVTPALFADYPTAKALAKADIRRLRRHLEPLRYAWTKADRLRETARRLVERHGGEVPRSFEDLTALAGVGPKTASVVQGYVWGEADTVAVDVHVNRVSYRLGLVPSPADAERARRVLDALYLRKDWPDVNYYLIKHGRTVCRARRPACGRCVVADLCPRIGVTETESTALKR